MKNKLFLPAFLVFASDLHAITVISFPDVATLISGTSEQINTQYRYSNVGTIAATGASFDAILTLSSEVNGASFSVPLPQPSPNPPRDTLIGVGENGRFFIEPSFISESPAGSLSYVEFNIRFVESNSLNAVVGETVSLVITDIDSQTGSDFSDIFGIQADLGGVYTLSNNTSLVSSFTVGSQDTYRTFSLDTSTDLTSAPNASVALANFELNQTPYTVQFDIADVGASGINFLWGMVEGATGTFDHNNVRRSYIDGTGTFAFVGETTTEGIPEPSSLLLVSLLPALAFMRRKR